jgi:hypothetical protein
MVFCELSKFRELVKLDELAIADGVKLVTGDFHLQSRAFCTDSFDQIRTPAVVMWAKKITGA